MTESVERLQSLSSKRHTIEVAVVARADHEMMLPADEKMEVNQNTIRNDEPQTPAYFMLLGSWLARHFPR